MTAIVTGGSGQLGCAFGQVWPEAEIWRRTELDLSASPGKIASKVRGAEADALVNAAAYTAVDQAEAEADLALRVNGSAVDAIVRGCGNADTRLFQVSTDYVFSGRPANGAAWQPDEEPAPRSVYGRSKHIGEAAALRYRNGYVIRTSWVFGNGHNFVRTMRQLGRKLEMVEVVDDQYGRPTFAPDLARAIRFLASQPELTQPIWHVQNSGPVITWAEFAEAIFDFDELDCQVKRVSTADYAQKVLAQGKPFAKRPECSVLQTDSLQAAGFALRDWRDALREYLHDTAP